MADPVPPRLYFPRQEFRDKGFSEPAIRALETAAFVGALLVRADNTDESLALKQPLSTILTALAGMGSSAGLVEQTGAETFAKRGIGLAEADDIPTRDDADSRYVQQDQGSAWTAATGTASRATFATHGGQAITNPPTQAEVQAIGDHLVILSQRLKALIDDLTGNGALKI